MFGVVIRPARDSDADSLIALIRACYEAYPGCILDVDHEAPELRAIASHHREQGGGFWVANQAGRLVGSIGYLPSADHRGLVLQKLYVAKQVRNQGLGTQLCRLVEDEARSRGARFVELWSDTRFQDAHRLYKELGYVKGPETRQLLDLSRSVEYYYRKE